MFHERTNKVKLCTKVFFRKLSLKDNLHNTRKTTEKIAGSFLAFAEYKRTIGLIYLLKIPIIPRYAEGENSFDYQFILGKKKLVICKKSIGWSI